MDFSRVGQTVMTTQERQRPGDNTENLAVDCPGSKVWRVNQGSQAQQQRLNLPTSRQPWNHFHLGQSTSPSPGGLAKKVDSGWFKRGASMTVSHKKARMWLAHTNRLFLLQTIPAPQHSLFPGPRSLVCHAGPHKRGPFFPLTRVGWTRRKQKLRKTLTRWRQP